MRNGLLNVCWLFLILSFCCRAGAESVGGPSDLPKAGQPVAPSMGNIPGMTERLGAQAAVDTLLLDEEGQSLHLRDLLNVPTLLLPVYFSCPSVCNVLQGNITSILPRVDLLPGRDFQVLSISFDPDDTPESARQRRNDFLAALDKDFPASGWRFLTGDKEDVDRLMASIGFQYRREGNQFVHPVAMVALAPGGKIVRYLYGYDLLPFDLTMAMTEAGQGKVGLSVKRVLAYCFSYDPAGKRYVVNYLRISAVVVLGLLLALFLALVLGGRRKTQQPGKGYGKSSE